MPTPHDTNLVETKQVLRRTDVWTFAAAAALAVFYFATSLYIASHRLFWFDEIFTVRVAWLPHWTTIWTALAHAVDAQPPFYDMVVRLFGGLFGHGEVAARLPSALAIAAGLLLTFDCSRRLTDGFHGLIALSVLTCSFLPYYGYEARPYALAFMFSALAFWIWCTQNDSKWSAVFFGAALCLAVMMHYYAVLNVVPYVVWEISTWRPRWRPSPKLIAGLLGVALPAALLSPLATAATRQFSRGFWSFPSVYGLRAVFSELFPDSLLLLVLIVIWVGLTRHAGTKTSVEEMQPAESLGWFFLCIPLAGFVVAELKTNAFVARYFIGALPGVAVAFSCWSWRHFHKTYRISAGIFLLLVAWGAAQQWKAIRHPESIDPTGERFQQKAINYLRLEGALHSDGKPFSVFSEPLIFLTAQYYSKDQCILLMPSSFAAARHASFRALQSLSNYYPMQFAPPFELGEHAHETALIQPTREVLDTLKKADFSLEVRFSEPPEVVYLK
jgi:hypothetical protein